MMLFRTVVLNWLTEPEQPAMQGHMMWQVLQLLQSPQQCTALYT